MRFDDGSRALYATDSSNYRQTPIGVVIPEVLHLALRKGGGTGIAAFEGH